MPQAASGGRCSGGREQDTGCEGNETKLEVGIWGLGAHQNSQGAKGELRGKKKELRFFWKVGRGCMDLSTFTLASKLLVVLCCVDLLAWLVLARGSCGPLVLSPADEADVPTT